MPVRSTQCQPIPVLGVITVGRQDACLAFQVSRRAIEVHLRSTGWEESARAWHTGSVPVPAFPLRRYRGGASLLPVRSL